MTVDNLIPATGWQARLQLGFQRREQRTVLRQCTHQGPLQGIAIDRFHALAKALTNARQRCHEGDLKTLLDEDLAWVGAHLDPETNAVVAYTAAARVLVDLVRLGWQAREEGYGLELVADKALAPHPPAARSGGYATLIRPTSVGQFSAVAALASNSMLRTGILWDCPFLNAYPSLQMQDRHPNYGHWINIRGSMEVLWMNY